MLSLGTLWLPIVVSAVFVFFASSIIHMVLKYHRAEYRAMPNEQDLLDFLKQADPAPGQYVVPHCSDPKELADPEFLKKYEEGPTGYVMIGPRRAPNMTKALIQWFVYCLVIGVFVGYIAAVTLPVGERYLAVFRVVGTAAILGYGGMTIVDSIWKLAPWTTTMKHLADAVIYALLTAGTFGWLWPR